MILKLDPRWPLTWRSPLAVQIGIDPVRVVLDEVSESDERMLAALTVGVSRSGLEMLGNGDPCELLARLEPVLQLPKSTAHDWRVAISGSGSLVTHLAECLARHGISVVTAQRASDIDGTPDLAIMVGHYVLSPESRGVWLRRDVPHLPVVFSDTGVLVGPLIEPNRAPCLLCLDLHRRDADSAWPAIATQLLGRRASAESELLSLETAALVARHVLERLGGSPADATATRIDAATGEHTSSTWRAHPECGCVELTSGLSEDRPEIGWGSVVRPAPEPR